MASHICKPASKPVVKKPVEKAKKKTTEK